MEHGKSSQELESSYENSLESGFYEPTMAVEKTRKNRKNVGSKFITSLRWRVPIFYRNSHGKHFSLYMAGLLALAIAIFFIQKDILMPLIIALVVFTLIVHTSKDPVLGQAKISARGIEWDGRLHHFQDLDSFWINYHPDGLRELSIKTTKWYMPYVKIPLENQNPVQLRNLVIQYLPEEKHEQSLLDAIARKI